MSECQRRKVSQQCVIKETEVSRSHSIPVIRWKKDGTFSALKEKEEVE